MNKKHKHKKILVFGVFDRLHPGHVSFLEQAAAIGDELVVVVARDASVLKLKNKRPYHSEQERMHAVRSLAGVTLVVLGDEKPGSYKVIEMHQPAVICLGYDQHGLGEDIKKRIKKGELASISLIKLDAHKPEVFHTSLMSSVDNLA